MIAGTTTTRILRSQRNSQFLAKLVEIGKGGQTEMQHISGGSRAPPLPPHPAQAGDRRSAPVRPHCSRPTFSSCTETRPSPSESRFAKTSRTRSWRRRRRRRRFGFGATAGPGRKKPRPTQGPLVIDSLENKQGEM